MKRADELSIEHERATLRAIRRDYDNLNGTFFRWQLRPPGFELSTAQSRLGRWVGSARLIELSRELLTKHGWGVLVEVLKHEMAHQYVDEVLGIHDEPSHGPAFRRVCEERHFDARSAGTPEAAQSSDEHARLLDRIAKLLALAESPNEHEAHAAMNAAQRLMLRYNIDAVGSGVRQSYVFRHLGQPSGRIPESQRLLAALLGEHFFVEVIWVPVWRALEGKRGTVLEICGSRENVELAEYVHVFLTHTADKLWREHKRAQRLRSDGPRQSFLSGVMSGFRDKLNSERTVQKQVGLVWVGDPALGQFFRRRHPSVRHSSYRTRSGSAAYADGQQAGRGIVLHRGVQAQSSGGGGRLLPSGGR